MATATGVIQSRWPIDYPESDGKPMAETDVHWREMVDAKEVLLDRYAGSPDVYVAGNLLLYFEEGDPSAAVAPDVFVVKGVAKHDRRIYKLWEEGVAPQVVIEVSSRSTRLEDLGNKRAIYAELGVREYFLVDPIGEYLKPPLQGWRLERSGYVAIEAEYDGCLLSRELELGIRQEGGRLRFVDLETRKPLLTPRERAEHESRARERAEQRAREAEQRAAGLEAELARLRARLEPRNG